MIVTKAEEQILMTVAQIRWIRNTCNKEIIDLFKKYYFEDKLLDWTGAFVSLVEKGLLHIKEDVYYITKPGIDKAKKLIRNRNSGLLWIKRANSKTYRILCKRVHEKDLCQDNFMDTEQFDKLFQMLNLNNQSKALETGCGIGTVTEFISDQTGASITGIDFAETAITLAQKRTIEKNKRLTFLVGDIDALDFPDGSFNTVIDIDSLNYAEDLVETMKRLANILKPGGQMAIFNNIIVPSEGDSAALKPQNTRLAELLKKNQLSFETYDYTENEKVHWIKVAKVAEGLKREFEKEGNFDLYITLISNAEKYSKLHEKNQRSRYLYHVHKD
jgi:ubiquinone/menaquinone biosynthesis C-methylase UbiE